jgi:hypothetical protein
MAKPQISIDSSPSYPSTYTSSQPAGFCLWYNVSQNQESTWTVSVSMDAYASDGTELTGYPVDLGNTYTTTSTTDSCPGSCTSPTSPQNYPLNPGGMVVFNVVGEWNDDTCYIKSGDTTPLMTCQPCDTWLWGSSPCYSYAAAHTKPAAPTDWSAQILGKVPQGADTVQVMLDVAGTPGHQIQFSYTILTKTAADATTFTPVTIGGQIRQRLTNPNAVKPRGGYVLPTPAAGDSSSSKEINDLVVTLPGGANYVYIDVVAVNVNDGNSIALPRFQLYP